MTITLYGTAWSDGQTLWFSFYEETSKEKLDNLKQPGDYPPYRGGAFKVKYTGEHPEAGVRYKVTVKPSRYRFPTGKPNQFASGTTLNLVNCTPVEFSS